MQSALITPDMLEEDGIFLNHFCKVCLFMSFSKYLDEIYVHLLHVVS